MKSLNQTELEVYLGWLDQQVGQVQVQSIWSTGHLVVLEIYKSGTLYLVFDLNPSAPHLLFLERGLAKSKKESKPVVLFLNSHAKNLRIDSIKIISEIGRAVELVLVGGERVCRIEAWLIPKNCNLTVEAENKKVSWSKPRDLPGASFSPEVKFSERDWHQYNQEWLEQSLSQNSKSGFAKPSVLNKTLEKKKKILETLQDSLKLEPEKEWRKLGEMINLQTPLSEAAQKLYEPTRDLNWNRDFAFAKAKELEKKKEGILIRIEELKSEISKIESGQTILADRSPANSVAGAVLKEERISGRKLHLENGCEALIGKSGKDNLGILRKARAWDYWFHLRDYPGAHAILFRNKNQAIPQQVIDRVAQWVIAESNQVKKLMPGTVLEVAVVECRFVRPLKGAAVGMVTYTNPQIFRIASKGKT